MKVLIIGGHGLGDCLLSLQCAVVLQRHGINPTIYISTRDAVFNPLNHLFGAYFNLKQISESYANDNTVLKDEMMMAELTEGFSEVYYVIPDLLFMNDYAFDFKKYHTSPQMIRNIRLLGPSDSMTDTIYLGLMTSTDGYSYYQPMELALALAYELPKNKIYFPIINQWAGKPLKDILVPSKLPGNLTVDINPDFKESMDILLSSCYFIGTDNGPSHVAYHASIPRLILDPQFNKLPWIARWREDYLESIPINAAPDEVCAIVSSNINVPQTTLIPRMVCLAHGKCDWNRLIWFKTK